MDRPDYQALANADINQSHSERNVHDHLKQHSVDELREISQSDRRPFGVAVLNVTGDLNTGTIVRNAHLTGAERVGIIGRRKYDKRGAVGAENYVQIDRIDGLQEDGITIDPDPFWSWLDQHDYVPFFVEQGGIPLHQYDWHHVVKTISPRKPCFVFGNENRGIDPLILWDPRGRVISLNQLGVIRSFNVASASAIVMYYVTSNMGWLNNAN